MLKNKSRRDKNSGTDRRVSCAVDSDRMEDTMMGGK
jgi:hypothetical protein